MEAEIAQAMQDLQAMDEQQIAERCDLMKGEIRMMKNELVRLKHQKTEMKEKIQENRDKVRMNKQLPYLVSSVVEVLDIDAQSDEEDEDGAARNSEALPQQKAVVVSTSTKMSAFLPMVGLVEAEQLEPGDSVGVNKDSYLILEKFPPEHDPKVKAMEVVEKPTEEYADVGGLDKQVEELVEAIVLPMTQAERFEKMGIKAPKGVLMYGPPGTGKTLLARACAAQTESTFLKLAAPQLNQMYIGDGARMVRDAFALAREKAPTIIFIDELDAVGTKRFDSDKTGDREVQRTMLELLNQMDGFSSDDRIKVIAATNRVDILDPALLRSGRFDRKIKFPHPDKDARKKILQIHSRRMIVGGDINFDEIARSCDDFSGAQCKAICIEAGMIALRRNATAVEHEDFLEGIVEVQAKKKGAQSYFV